MWAPCAQISLLRESFELASPVTSLKKVQLEDFDFLFKCFLEEFVLRSLRASHLTFDELFSLPEGRMR